VLLDTLNSLHSYGIARDLTSGVHATKMPKVVARATWFDHSIWYMVNNLGVFFPDATYPSLPSKFGAFLTWMKSVVRLAVKTHITFMVMRCHMEVAALEYAIDPS
jgi:hypothetical protein